MTIDPLTATATQLCESSSQYSLDILLSGKTQVLSRGHAADSISMTLATSPPLDANDHFALSQDTKVDGLLDTPLEATVDILLPVSFFEIGLLPGEEERVDTAVQV